MRDNQRHTLRTGITTGTCAAGAAKASAIHLTSGIIPESVTVKNPDGLTFSMPVSREGEYFCVVKDSGDDRADITNGAKILARVEIVGGEGGIEFVAGNGVGTVTLPGLKIPPGEPAINPIPREMIRTAIREIIPHMSVRVIISVPGGEALAQRTFNPRLGIVGGISILGTTGIVKPMNEAALLESLTLEMNMIRSIGFSDVYIAFAGTGEKFTRRIFSLDGRNVIQCGNYPGHVLDEATRLGFTHATICGHPGKMLKVAAGSFITHSRVADGRLEALCTHLALMGAGQNLIRRIYHSNTTNEAIDIIRASGFCGVWENIAGVISRKCRERTQGELKVDAVIFDADGKILGASHGA
ncbi:MAG: cobalamin biosynthesis protein CbiD [Synergistaceae bacterium]|nr:cobalamin biosynthesis protein CbiD [Synergistaceae bacterium]